VLRKRILTSYRPWQPNEAKKHIRSQVENARVTAVSGEEMQLPVGDHKVSLCCHSDLPGAVEIVNVAREIVDEFNKTNFS
jgi:lactam utilization protein B